MCDSLQERELEERCIDCLRLLVELAPFTESNKFEVSLTLARAARALYFLDKEREGGRYID